MSQEKGGLKGMWKSFGEKTAWMETGTGKAIITVLAVLMIGWSAYSMVQKSNEIDAARGQTPADSYTLSE